MPTYSQPVEAALRSAGWRPGRSKDVEPWRLHFEVAGCHMSDVVESFLSEYGGLDVSIGGRGRERAIVPFDLEPMLCDGEEGRFIDLSSDYGRQMFPLGVFDGMRYLLAMDETGEIYLLIDSDVRSFGKMPTAMERMILGDMPVRVVSEGEG